MTASSERHGLSRWAWLPIAAALATMALKAWAYGATRSVGLLADALESLVNLAAAVFALVALRVAERPPDRDHLYGHEKAEYFASGAEGTLIVIAAGSIAWTGIERLFHPRDLVHLDRGMVLAVAAAAINLAVGLVLLSAGRRLRSVALAGGGLHLMTDVWSTAGVLVALLLVRATGWPLFDPLVALALAVQVGWTGIRLLRGAMQGLMDSSLPAEQVRAVQQVLAALAAQDVRHHALRTRRAGARSFVSFHVQVPGAWTVQRGHDLLETIEDDIRAKIPQVSVFSHLEPLEDPRSWDDETLDRAVRSGTRVE